MIAFTAKSLDLRINTTPSMPIGLYRVRPLHLERGVWVVFCLPDEPARLGRARAYLREGPCPDGSQELLKEVVAVPGDKVVLSRAGLIVNGHSIQGSALRAVDRGRRTLSHAPFGERCIAPGELWVLGLDQRVSWDSRYFGPVPLDHVRALAIPMLTFGADLHRGLAKGEVP
jgi:conjugative transfer signal peptidase TraF